ncbi:variant leucine-rich repeat-containing protein, partial [Actinomyces naeslundii]
MTSVANAAPGRDAATTRGQAPDDPDLRLARDPKAGAGRLMVLAGNRPDLRAVIVDNPGCSPELRAWVGRMGVVGSGRSGRSVVEADSIGGSSAGDSGGAGDFGDSVSMAPTGWEPSDIGLGDDPFGSVLGDPLMGSPLFDGGPGDGPDDADVVGSAGGDADRAARPARSGGQDRTSSRRTSRPHTAAARTASRTTPPRTSSPRT